MDNKHKYEFIDGIWKENNLHKKKFIQFTL